MRYKVMSGFVLNGGRLAEVGTTVVVGEDIDEAQAKSLLARGRVIPVEAAPAPTPSAEHVTVGEGATGDPALGHEVLPLGDESPE